MEIYDYFESLQRGIQQNHVIGFLEDPVLIQAWDDHTGLFRARVFFWDTLASGLADVDLPVSHGRRDAGSRPRCRRHYAWS
ncbi:MAG: hypothetical protein HY023_04180 [Chloroflexi bacterium]|nr:hypothetical protein [Chloroflexota bacterium]